MKYKIGDKVRVRKDLEVDLYYGGDSFTSGMKKYLGKTVTISYVDFNHKYFIAEDDEKWNWTDEMFEDEDITILVKGDKVIAKMGNKVGIAKCSPEDEFNIFTGVRLAIDRLEEKYNPYSWLKWGVTYYIPHLSKDNLYDYYTYSNDCVDKRFISRGLVFKTKEEAINCAKKMLEIVK